MPSLPLLNTNQFDEVAGPDPSILSSLSHLGCVSFEGCVWVLPRRQLNSLCTHRTDYGVSLSASCLRTMVRPVASMIETKYLLTGITLERQEIELVATLCLTVPPKREQISVSHRKFSLGEMLLSFNDLCCPILSACREASRSFARLT